MSIITVLSGYLKVFLGFSILIFDKVVSQLPSAGLCGRPASANDELLATSFDWIKNRDRRRPDRLFE